MLGRQHACSYAVRQLHSQHVSLITHKPSLTHIHMPHTKGSYSIRLRATDGTDGDALLLFCVEIDFRVALARQGPAALRGLLPAWGASVLGGEGSHGTS